MKQSDCWASRQLTKIGQGCIKRYPSHIYLSINPRKIRRNCDGLYIAISFQDRIKDRIMTILILLTFLQKISSDYFMIDKKNGKF